MTVHLRTVGDACGQGASVVDAPYTGDLDLTVVTGPGELAALLRTVHLRADRPSLRVLEARTRHEPTPLSKTAVSEMLKGARFPRKAVMVAFLRACGERDDRIEAWRHAWDRIAVREHGVTARAALDSADIQHAQALGAGSDTAPDIGAAEAEQLRDEVHRLNEDNKKLRLQIAEATRPAAAPQTQSDDSTTARHARGPEVRRRELGAQLRALRTEQGLTVEQVAGHLFCSPGKVSRMENGFRSGTLRDVRDLCELYGVSDASQRDHLMELARQSKQRGWWQDFDLSYQTYIGLEADAASIRSYQSTVVPGLLQTAAYARVIHENLARRLSPEVIEQRVQARLIRQRLLTQSDPPIFLAILDEAVLHRIVGSAAVMADQLDQLIDLSGLENVSIEVIPYESGAHPGVGGAFDILELAASLPAVVYVEGLFGQIYLERPQDVDRFQNAFEALHTASLDQGNSRRLITEIRKDLKI
jgi:transcriptional regulator with XRE-family HTH domain